MTTQETVLANLTADRKRRGLAIAATPGGVKPLSIQRQQWLVHSERLATTYHVNLAVPRCDCPDQQARRMGIPCKHQHAARLTEVALQAAPELAARRQISLAEFADRLLVELATGVTAPAGITPAIWADKLQAILNAANYLVEQAAKEAARKQVELDMVRCPSGNVIVETATDPITGARVDLPENPALASAELIAAGYHYSHDTPCPVANHTTAMWVREHLTVYA